jgi:mucin-5AC
MNKIRGTPKNTHYNPDHKEKHAMPLHTFTTILQISAGIMILYGIRDEYKRYRDKKKGKIVKRLPRLEGAATIFGCICLVGFFIALFIALPASEWLPNWYYFAGGILSAATGIALLYRYETKYLSINPDATITYRGSFGQPHTAPVSSINEYKYTPGHTHLNNEYIEDNLWLWDSKNNTIATYSPEYLKEYSIMAHLVFRCARGHWPDMNNPDEAAIIKKATTSKGRGEIIRYLQENTEATGLANHTPTPA